MKKLRKDESKNKELTDEQVTKVKGGGVQDVSATYGGCGKDVAKDWAKSHFGYYQECFLHFLQSKRKNT